MKTRLFLFLGLFSILLLCTNCGNPYKGFSGVSKKGMKKNKLPSQQLKEDYDKVAKKMQKAYKKEQKKTSKRLGTKEEK